MEDFFKNLLKIVAEIVAFLKDFVYQVSGGKAGVQAPAEEPAADTETPADGETDA
jgi:hypothetical protein